VMLLISILAAISYPSVNSGLDSLRINSAADSISAFLTSALNYADRRQDAVEIVISKATNTITAESVRRGYLRKLEIPEGIHIQEILPPSPSIDEPERRFLLLPGGTVPKVGVALIGSGQKRRIVSVDPISGATIVERPEQP